MRKKKQFSQYHDIIIIGIILLIVVVGILKQQSAFMSEKNNEGTIKGIRIGNTNYSCGIADDICPSDYANCMPCVTEDPDCKRSTAC